MAFTQDYFSGKKAQVGVNGVQYDGQGWTVEADGEEARTDNTSTNGYSDRIVAMKDATVTLDFIFDASSNIMDSPPSLAVGSVLTNLRCYGDYAGSSAWYWSFPKAIVTKVSNPAKLGPDAVKLTITCKNKGAFAPPTGTFAPSAIGA